MAKARRIERSRNRDLRKFLKAGVLGRIRHDVCTARDSNNRTLRVRRREILKEREKRFNSLEQARMTIPELWGRSEDE